MFSYVRSRTLVLLAASSFPCTVFAQSLPAAEQASVQTGPRSLTNEAPRTPSALSSATTPPAAVTILAGTHVMMILRSPLRTTSGTEGSGIYLDVLYPVIQDNRVVIPAHTQVQGIVDGNQRPGHVQRTAEFRFRFTSLIFPNSNTVSIDGALQSIPGSRSTRVQREDKTLRTVDQAEKVVPPAAVGAVGGAIIGSTTRFGIGKFVGAGLGAGLGLGGALLKRGDAIGLPVGTSVEMLLQSPLPLDSDQAAFNAHYVPPPEVQLRTPNSNETEQEKPRRSRPRQRMSPWSLPGVMFQHD